MSHDDPMPRCKHDRRVYDDCPECENEAEIALSEDTAKYIAKLKARIARLQAVARNLRAAVHYGVAKPYAGADAGRYLAEAIAALDQCDTHHDLGDEAP